MSNQTDYPYLKIARDYNVEYWAVLMYAQYLRGSLSDDWYRSVNFDPLWEYFNSLGGCEKLLVLGWPLVS